METTTRVQVDPSKITQIGMGFFASKTLLTAVNMGLFTLLAKGDLSGQNIKEILGLNDRGLYDFLDTLVALGFLKRTGLKETSIYSNAEDANLFLDKNKPTYVGGMLEMSNNRLYPFWNNLEEGLKTGKPQHETKTGEAPIFEALYADKPKLREFLKAMGGIQMGNFMMFAKRFDFLNCKTLCDVGGAGGYLAAQVALNNQHMSCISFDLPPVEPVALENIKMMGLSDRVSAQSGDFLTDDLPKADVITMGNVLHDWGTKEKKMLIKKAYESLPQGGALVVIENIIDDNRSENAFGLMMSLNMNIETPEGFDFSAADFDEWARECGFTQTSVMPLTGPSSAVIAIK
ncbi:hypothetical protein K8352_01280 [Flavobacteriaceae bacterium F89]|uniref:Methyltransferase n=1 Tax=Cerina litoralis TaxID=2874477 RepID=A0AAE3JN11_9FLAO|nr:methyltransferase [Cerina litoralis]MCG2459374.1 hypothetical protein [Cerina litoralis]